MLVVGASVRAAVDSACRAGVPCRAIDLFGDLDLSAPKQTVPLAQYPRGLATAAMETPADEWLYTGGLENHPALVARVSQRHRLLGNSADVLRPARDPWQLARIAERAGCPCPDRTTEASEVPRDGRWLLKTAGSSGGVGIARWHGQPRTPGQRRRGYFERWVEGCAASALFVANGRCCQMLGATQQLLCGATNTEPGFRYAGSIGPLALSAEQHGQLQALGDGLAEHFALKGLFGVDFVIAPDGRLWTIEVNPRYTASVEVLERSLDRSLLALHLAACRTSELPPARPPPWPPATPCGKQIVYARHDGQVSHPAVMRWLAARQATGAAWPTWADLPRPGTPFQRGDPLLTVLAQANDTAAVVRQLAALAAEAWQLLA